MLSFLSIKVNLLVIITIIIIIIMAPSSLVTLVNA